jgi:hypothetical protein
MEPRIRGVAQRTSLIVAALNDMFRKMANLLPVTTRYQLHCLQRSNVAYFPRIYNLGLETIGTLQAIANALMAKVS